MTDPAPDRAAPEPTAPDPAEHDLELTVSALRDGPTALGIHGALVEIRRWQERIDGTDAPALQEIGAALAELRGELESDTPDTAVLTDLMRRLAAMTLTAAADQPEGNLRSRLEELGTCSTAGPPRSTDGATRGAPGPVRRGPVRRGPIRPGPARR